jgi:hypothetical protein
MLLRYRYEDRQIAQYLGRSVEGGFTFREFLLYLKNIDIYNCNIHHRMQFHPIETCIDPEDIYVIKLEEAERIFLSIEDTISD